MSIDYSKNCSMPTPSTSVVFYHDAINLFFDSVFIHIYVVLLSNSLLFTPASFNLLFLNPFLLVNYKKKIIMMELFYETKVDYFLIRHDKESSAHHFISTFKYSLLYFYCVPTRIVIQYITCSQLFPHVHNLHNLSRGSIIPLTRLKLQQIQIVPPDIFRD